MKCRDTVGQTVVGGDAATNSAMVAFERAEFNGGPRLAKHLGPPSRFSNGDSFDCQLVDTSTSSTVDSFNRRLVQSSAGAPSLMTNRASSLATSSAKPARFTLESTSPKSL